MIDSSNEDMLTGVSSTIKHIVFLKSVSRLIWSRIRSKLPVEAGHVSYLVSISDIWNCDFDSFKIHRLTGQRIKKNNIVAELRSKAVESRHVVAQILLQLIETDGAGSWLPKASHYQTYVTPDSVIVRIRDSVKLVLFVLIMKYT
jgi:hypothetical protein